METSFLKHIYWRSRRGMLEIELKLVPFVRDHYSELSEAEQQAYAALLELEDWEIFDWLQEREQPEDPVLRGLIAKIIACTGTL